MKNHAASVSKNIEQCHSNPLTAFMEVDFHIADPHIFYSAPQRPNIGVTCLDITFQKNLA